MAKSEIKSGANIGSASLILIFIVLCLGTFGLLSLTSARNDLDLAERNAEAVSGFYQADSQGEAFRMQVDTALQDALQENPEDPEAGLTARLGEAYHAKEQSAWMEIPMNSGQALAVKIGISWKDGRGRTRIRQWNVYNREEYEIDQAMPVWSGEPKSGEP
ncbi:MAG: hypothetical protein Q4C66_12330 [Lachnospiraceae bacterium]|nr:hypothetical protein [Lachnospiraceae bacterium]